MYIEWKEIDKSGDDQISILEYMVNDLKKYDAIDASEYTDWGAKSKRGRSPTDVEFTTESGYIGFMIQYSSPGNTR